MSRQPGGYIGFNRVPAASAQNSAASGVWTLREAEANRRAGTWPTSHPGGVGAGLQLWLDADDANTLYNATTGGSLVAADGAVARWQDKSGNGRHFTQSSSSRQPLRTTAVQNSRNVLRFDGSDDYLVGGDYLDITGNQSVTIFVVLKRAAQNVTHEVINKYGRPESTNAGNADNGILFQVTSANKPRINATDGNNNTIVDTVAAFDASSFTALAWKLTSGSFASASVFVNGQSVSTSTPKSTLQSLTDTSYEWRIGISRFSASFYDPFNGDIAEIIMYDSALSDTNRQAVENYLLAKWGIT